MSRGHGAVERGVLAVLAQRADHGGGEVSIAALAARIFDLHTPATRSQRSSVRRAVDRLAREGLVLARHTRDVNHEMLNGERGGDQESSGDRARAAVAMSYGDPAQCHLDGHDEMWVSPGTMSRPGHAHSADRPGDLGKPYGSPVARP